MAPASTRLPGAGRSTEAATRSSGSSSRSFRLLEPAFATRILMASRCSSPPARRAVRMLALLPGPVAHFGWVVPGLAGVPPRLLAKLLHARSERSRLAREAGNTVDHVHHQPITVEVVHH